MKPKNTAFNIAERFWGRVEKTPSCWIFKKRTGRGYGTFFLLGKVRVQAHRFAYELLKGLIPQGLVIDHLCENTLCVNPAHLKPTTINDNAARGINANPNKTNCPQGHPYDEHNTLRRPNGHRRCRLCHRAQEAKRKASL